MNNIILFVEFQLCYKKVLLFIDLVMS